MARPGTSISILFASKVALSPKISLIGLTTRPPPNFPSTSPAMSIPLSMYLVIETFRIHKTEIIREPLLCGVDGKAMNIDLNPICFKGCPIPKNQPHRTYDPASAKFSFYFTCNEHTFVYVMVQDGPESFKVFLAQVY